jgi:hypothetical protein
MFSWWNSLEIVSRLSTASNCAIALLGIWVFVIGRRESALTDTRTTQANSARDFLISANNLSTEEAKRDVAKANERAAALEKDATVARLELEQLKEKQRPRTITSEQRETFIAFMSHRLTGKVSFKCLTNDNEAEAFAGQLKELVSQSGCEVSNTMLGFITSGAPISGIYIKIKSGAAPPPHAGNLQKAFKAIGITALGAEESPAFPLSENEVVIYVYGKN